MTKKERMEKIEKIINNFLSIKSKTDNCYFWEIGNPKKIKTDNYQFELTKFKYKNDDYTLSIDVYFSWRHAYRTVSILKNGVKKDIRILKNILKEIKEGENAKKC